MGYLLFVPLAVPIFVPWSGINCRHKDINLKMLESLAVLSPDRKREIVNSIFTAWQQAGDPRQADKWMRNLQEEAVSKMPEQPDLH